MVNKWKSWRLPYHFEIGGMVVILWPGQKAVWQSENYAHSQLQSPSGTVALKKLYLLSFTSHVWEKMWKNTFCFALGLHKCTLKSSERCYINRVSLKCNLNVYSEILKIKTYQNTSSIARKLSMLLIWVFSLATKLTQ